MQPREATRGSASARWRETPPTPPRRRDDKLEVLVLLVLLLARLCLRRRRGRRDAARWRETRDVVERSVSRTSFFFRLVALHARLALLLLLALLRAALLSSGPTLHARPVRVVLHAHVVVQNLEHGQVPRIQ